MWIPSAHDLPYLFPKVFTFCNKKEAATGHRASRPLVDGAERGTEADVEASREGRLGRWRSKRARSRTLREHRTPEGSGDLIGVAVWIGALEADGQRVQNVLHHNRVVVCPEPDLQLNGNMFVYVVEW